MWEGSLIRMPQRTTSSDFKKKRGQQKKRIFRVAGVDKSQKEHFIHRKIKKNTCQEV